jgi:RNA polymerase sigma-70 factor (ECF subfamily)
LQQTWLRVWRGIGSLKEPQRLTAWLYRVTRNTAMNHARLQAAYRAGLEERPVPVAFEEESDTFDPEDAEQVHAALLRLTLPHREALTLFFLEDLSIEEIADIVGIQPGTVKSRLHYAKQALRKVLQEETARHE